MIIAGIDAGKTGAVAYLNTVTEEVKIYDLDMKSDGLLDAEKLFNIWSMTTGSNDSLLPELIIIEDVFRPHSLVRMVGAIEGLASLINCTIKRVSIVSWKTKILGANTSDKKVSIDICKKLYPKANIIRPGKRKEKESHDRAEAVLLAHYGLILSR